MILLGRIVQSTDGSELTWTQALALPRREPPEFGSLHIRRGAASCHLTLAEIAKFVGLYGCAVLYRYLALPYQACPRI